MLVISRLLTGRLTIAIALASACFSVHADTAKIPVERFFQQSTLSAAKLSPDGHFLALRVAAKNQHAVLGVMDLATFKTQPVASFADSDIGEFDWVNDHRLVFNLTENGTADRDVHLASGLYAVNRDGSSMRQLVEHTRWFFKDGDDKRRLQPWNTFLLGTMPFAHTDQVFVWHPEGVNGSHAYYASLMQLDTATGRTKDVDTPLHSVGWLLDEKGNPCMSTGYEDNKIVVHLYDSASGAWRKVAEFNEFSIDGFTPAFCSTNGDVYVVAHHGHNTKGLYRFDTEKNTIADKPVVASQAYDFDGKFIYNEKKVLGVRYMLDAEFTLWFDEQMKVLQKTVNDLLPATINRISVASEAQASYVLVQAFSDVQPDVFFLFDTRTNKLIKLGSAHPEIVASQMASKDMIRYKARDGLEIPAYLTLPNGTDKKNLPLIVLVHGGPWLRGVSWRWNPEVQFLASRGYAVLEPEFRGSTGFGAKHFTAGRKQWGLAMQDDVTDGTKWAIAQGIADPKRICIAGASYGGYATLMGLAKEPDLYRCGFEWAGVTDISLMYSVSWSDMSATVKQYGMPFLIGDKVKDAAQLKATSPLENAARIRQPLLLAYGGADRRVPIIHGEKFRDAVQKTNPDVEWIEYLDEGHGWKAPATNIDFWTHVEKFLDHNIGKP